MGLLIIPHWEVHIMYIAKMNSHLVIELPRIRYLLVYYIKQQFYCILQSESLIVLAASKKTAHTTKNSTDRLVAEGISCTFF